MEPIFNHKVDRVINRIVLIWIALVLIFAIYNTITWKDSIHNPDNAEYINEVAFNEGCEPYQVTQKQFNSRYTK